MTRPDDWVRAEADGTVDFGGMPPKYVDLPGYEWVRVESDDGWAPPDHYEAVGGDGEWTFEDGGILADIKLNGQVRLLDGQVKPRLTGPPEPIEGEDGVEFVIPLGDHDDPDAPAYETVQLGVFECQRCGTPLTIPQHDDQLRAPGSHQECAGCERQGVWEHASGRREDVTGRQLLGLVPPVWDPPTGVDMGDDERDALDGLWDDLRQFIRQHWCAHRDDEFMYDGMAAWAMTTWVKPNLSAVAHLVVQGRFLGGKTRVLKTLRRVSYRGAVYVSATEASMFRLIDSMDVTPFWTEFHRWPEEEQDRLETLLMGGYNRDEQVARTQEVSGAGWVPQSFDPFTSMAVATQHGMEDDIVSRSVTIKTAKRWREVKEEFDDRSEYRAQAIRNRLLYLRWRLLDSKVWDAAMDSASDWLDDHDIADRTKQILKGMTAMAVIFDKLDAFEPFALEIKRQVKLAQAQSDDALLIDIIRDMALAQVGELTEGDQQFIGDPWSKVKIYYGDVMDRVEDQTGREFHPHVFGEIVNNRFFLDTGRDSATYIQDDDLKKKLRRLVEDAELTWREPTPGDADDGADKEQEVADARELTQRYLRQEARGDDTVTPSKVSAWATRNGMDLSVDRAIDALSTLKDQSGSALEDLGDNQYRYLG